MMSIFSSVTQFQKTGYQTAVALGFFDGVHLGHRAVIERTVDYAKHHQLKSVVLTFSAVPKKRGTKRLTLNEKKAALLQKLGVDAVIFADFESLKDLSAEAFFENVLVGSLRAKAVMCGFNFHFAKNAAADSETLRQLAEQRGIDAQIVAPVFFEEQPVSSTRIRACLEDGDIARANRMLGDPFSVEGVIARGNQIGHALGFPTVNLPLEHDTVIPRWGVYASRVEVDNHVFLGATNIGVHPSVKREREPVCETFLLDFADEALYEKRAVCRLERFLREEQTFSSIEALKAQIEKDCETVKNMEKKPQE